MPFCTTCSYLVRRNRILLVHRDGHWINPGVCLANQMLRVAGSQAQFLHNDWMIFFNLDGFLIDTLLLKWFWFRKIAGMCCQLKSGIGCWLCLGIQMFFVFFNCRHYFHDYIVSCLFRKQLFLKLTDVNIHAAVKLEMMQFASGEWEPAGFGLFSEKKAEC